MSQGSTFPAAEPHGALEEIAEGVFWVQGSIKMGPGVRISRNMAIVRSGTDLTVISSVRLSEEGELALGKLGTVRHVVKIGASHGRDDAYYMSRFDAPYWALPGGARKVDPTPSRELSPTSLPFEDAELFQFEHTLRKEAAIVVKRAGGILITCDALQHWPNTKGCSAMAKLVARGIGFLKTPVVIGPPWRKSMTPPKGSLQEDFDRLASLEFKHMVGAHGAALRDTAKENVRIAIDMVYG